MIRNANRNTILAQNVRIADCFLGRLKGLLGTNRLAEGAALIIKPCSSVHTFGMKYAIDVLFIDKGGRVCKVVHSLTPRRLAWAGNSSYVIELPSGTLKATNTLENDIIQVFDSLSSKSL